MLTTNRSDDSPFTMDVLRASLARFAKIPPPPMFVSSVLFPNDGALKFAHDGRTFVCAGTELWSKLPLARDNHVNPICSQQVFDIDDPVYRRERAMVLSALAAVAGRAFGDIGRINEHLNEEPS